MIIYFLRVLKFVWWGKRSYYLQSNFLDILEPNFMCWCWRHEYTLQRRFLSYQKLNAIQYFFSLDRFDPTQCKYWYDKYSLMPYWQSIMYILTIKVKFFVVFSLSILIYITLKFQNDLEYNQIKIYLSLFCTVELFVAWFDRLS